MSEKNGSGQPILPKILTGVGLVLICAVALFLRAYYPQTSVFRDGGIYFKENDPWYHVRLVENLLQHFPRPITFDPYTYFPYGQQVWFAPLFDLLIAAAVLVISLGNPTTELIHTVAVYFPAVMGMLVVPIVYFIGKELFNYKAGLIAAAMVAIMPGTFLARSLAGFTDHHVAEVFFSALTFLFLIMATKRSSKAGITFSDVIKRDWQKVRKPLIYSLLAGISLAMYLLAWSAGLLLVFILFCAVVVVYIIDYLKGRSTEYFVITGTVTFVASFILLLPFLGVLPLAYLCALSLAACVLVLPALYLVSYLMEKTRLQRAFYPGVLLVLGLIAGTGLYIVDQPLFFDILYRFRVFTPETGALTISEARPLFYSRGPFSLEPAWDDFTTGAIMAPLAFIAVVWQAIKKVRPEIWLFVVWCVVMTAATLGQIRFSYYLAVNVALLGGYFLYGVGALIFKSVDLVFLKEYYRELKLAAASEKRKKRQAKTEKENEETAPAAVPQKPLWPRLISNTLTELVVFFVVFFPNYQPALNIARSFSGPNKDWRDALIWLRTNTPEPFGDADFYYSDYQAPADGLHYDYPDSAYGVMSWWDYGHWITEIGHRIPNANPHQAGAVTAANFFIAQDEESANKILNEAGSRYVIIDLEMAVPYYVSGTVIQRGKYYAMPIWAGETPDKYFEVLYRPNNGKMEQVPVYYPEYYRSMCTRLYIFKGEAQAPRNTTVIGFTQQPGYKEIIAEQQFDTYEEALEFVTKQNSPNWKIVGRDPFVSPVPLEALEHYKVAYQSESWAAKMGEKVVSYLVEVYSYTP